VWVCGNRRKEKREEEEKEMDGVGFEKTIECRVRKGKKKEEEVEKRREEKRERKNGWENWNEVEGEAKTHNAVICLGKQKFKIIIGICTIKYIN